MQRPSRKSSTVPASIEELDFELARERWREQRARRRLVELELIERIWLLVVLTGAAILAAASEPLPAGATIAAASALSAARWKRTPTEPPSPEAGG